MVTDGSRATGEAMPLPPVTNEPPNEIGRGPRAPLILASGSPYPAPMACCGPGGLPAGGIRSRATATLAIRRNSGAAAIPPNPVEGYGGIPAVARGGRGRGRRDLPVLAHRAPDQAGLDPDAAVGDGGVDAGHLERGHRDPLADRDRSHAGPRPSIGGEHDAGRLAGEPQPGGVPEPEAIE